MTRFRRLLCACALAICAVAACATAASATVFYVNQRNGEAEGTAKCGLQPGGAEAKHENPCLKISEGVKKAEAVAGPNTIEVAEGEYKEEIVLKSAGDNLLTINGEEPGVEVLDKANYAAEVETAAGAVVLSNMKLASVNGPDVVRDHAANVSLVNDSIEGEEVTNGVEVTKGSTLALEGGSVTLENSGGNDVSGGEAIMHVKSAQLVSGAGGIAPESGGILSRKSALTVSGTTIVLEGSPVTPTFGITAEKEGSATIQSTRVKQGGKWIGVVFEDTPATVEGLKVEMIDPASTVEAVDVEAEGGASTFSHLETSGTWIGPAMLVAGGDITIADSSIAANTAGEALGLKYFGTASTRGLVLERSVVQAGAHAPSALAVSRGNATLDSSAVLGGRIGVAFEAEPKLSQQLTVSASTVDAGAPGVASDAPGTTGVQVSANGAGTTAAASIQGSIVLERQAATEGAGDTASISCSYSAVPSQTQPAGGGAGAIECASGAHANTESNPLSTLFPEPLSGYQLSPSSAAIDSVPAGAIALPFGITPSATDLAGKPRVVDGNGDCIAVQDKGALELQGHAAACPTAVSPSTTLKSLPLLTVPLGVISALTISPSSFVPAPSGATIAKAKGKPKKKYGATISWRDSQPATTTFTVLSEVKGRKQGKSCKKPSKSNKRGKPCELLIKMGSFIHVDVSGANSLRFSGRLKGKALAKGVYKLQAVPRNATGSGLTVSKSFTIK
jgi:hypothetical protein